jgi:ABC-type dipeptide/oligopeptide/nickel transport system permease subunit
MPSLTRESPTNESADAPVLRPVEAADNPRTYRAMVWRQFRRNWIAVGGLVLIGLLFVIAVAAPVIANNKPILMRWDGRLSSPMLREIFAPGREVPERFLERVFNYALVLSAASLVLLAPLWLAVRRKAWRMAALGWAAAALAVICLVPFFLVQSRLDKTDYRARAEEARSPWSPGNWLILAPVPYGPFEQLPSESYAAPSAAHPMGADISGRDVLARVIHGARVSLSVGFLSMGVAVIIGLFVGAVSAYHGGWTDLLLQRVVEIVICFPVFLLILTIMAFMEQRSIFSVMLVIGLTGWTGITRLVRGQMLSENAKDYVVAAHALGASSWRVMFRHLLPNSIAPVFVAISFGVAGAILTESALSFLGFGVSPPTASWGELLNEAQTWPTGYWWLTCWPGVMIFVTVTVYNLAGEGLRDALDPRLKI